MGERREIVAEIVSCVTGIPEDKLEEFETLKALLEKADNPGNEEHFHFGLLTFCWPWGSRKDFPKLVIVNWWSPNFYKMQELETQYWPHHARPVPSLAHFSLSEEAIQRAKEKLVQTDKD